MKINAGEYGRTNKGRILVFSWLQDDNGKTMKNCVVKYVNGGVIKYWLDKDEQIVKHSKNIIDLIEVGDYVNGYYVEKVWEQVNYRMAIDLRGSYLGLSDDKFIETIVTHEQMQEMEYKI